MSKHNRERRLLWKLGLHKKQIARREGQPRRASHVEIRAAREAHFLQTRSTR